MKRCLCLLLALLLGLPATAMADARDDARRSFKLGMSLIAGGQQAEGVRHLETAYELLPHPSVLYNIGLAYADAGDFDAAISAFEEYLDWGTPDTAAVETLIILLKQQKRDAAAPATVEAGGEPEAGPSEPTEPGAAQIASTPEVEALIARLESLANKLSGDAPIDTAPTAEVIDEGALEQRQVGDIYEEVVVSASRQATSPADAPAATTIITAEQIRLSGATSIQELLRAVPGMSILTMGASDANLAMRGFNQRVSNKLLVLIDGRSTYLDFLGGTLYNNLSIQLQDIERIEVLRGPNSTLYGANAFGGVVNIITKQPGAEQGGQVAVTGGSGETILSNVQFSGRQGIFGYRGSVGFEQTNRYESEVGQRSDLEYVQTDPDLAGRALKANVGFRLVPTRKISLGLSGGLTYQGMNFFALGLFRDFWLEGLRSNLKFDAKFGGLNIRAFWNYFNVVASESYIPIGGSPVAHNQPVSNVVDVEANYTASAMTGPVKHDLALGAGYRLKTIDWEWLPEAKVEQHLKGFVEDRITFAPQFATVLGFRFDHHPLVGFTPSPRVAFMIKPTERQSLRLSAGTAFRTPTFLESYLDLKVPTGVVTGVSINSRGSTDLEPENIVSAEVGYVFEDSDFLSFEVAAYYQRVTNLIALGPIEAPDQVQGLQDGRFVAGASTFGNIGDVFHGIGAEGGIHAFPVRGLDIRANYSFNYTIDEALLNDGVDDFRDKRHPMHSAHIGASYRAPFGLDANVDVHIVSEVSVPERSFSPDGEVLIEGCESDAYAMVNARVGYRLLKDRLEFGVTAFNIGGWVDGGHREHCFATRVGPRVLGTAIFRF